MKFMESGLMKNMEKFFSARKWKRISVRNLTLCKELSHGRKGG